MKQNKIIFKLLPLFLVVLNISINAGITDKVVKEKTTEQNESTQQPGILRIKISNIDNITIRGNNFLEVIQVDDEKEEELIIEDAGELLQEDLYTINDHKLKLGNNSNSINILINNGSICVSNIVAHGNIIVSTISSNSIVMVNGQIISGNEIENSTETSETLDPIRYILRIKSLKELSAIQNGEASIDQFKTEDPLVLKASQSGVIKIKTLKCVAKIQLSTSQSGYAEIKSLKCKRFSSKNLQSGRTKIGLLVSSNVQLKSSQSGDTVIKKLQCDKLKSEACQAGSIVVGSCKCGDLKTKAMQFGTITMYNTTYKKHKTSSIQAGRVYLNQERV